MDVHFPPALDLHTDGLSIKFFNNDPKQESVFSTVLDTAGHSSAVDCEHF